MSKSESIRRLSPPYIAILVIFNLLGGCSTPRQSPEELELKALQTGDWSEVTKYEARHRAENLRKYFTNYCNRKGLMLYCSTDSFGLNTVRDYKRQCSCLKY